MGADRGTSGVWAHIDLAVTAVYRRKGSIETAQEWRISFRNDD
ncbi:hypothetical protein [Streptomyces sp. NPDC056549]